MIVQEREEASEQEWIADGLRRIMSPDARSFFQISLFNGRFLRRAVCTSSAFLTQPGFGEFRVEVTTVSRFGCLLLLLLFQGCSIEFAIGGSRCIIAALGCLAVFGFLAFLLFRETFEKVGNFIDRLVPSR